MKLDQAVKESKMGMAVRVVGETVIYHHPEHGTFLKRGGKKEELEYRPELEDRSRVDWQPVFQGPATTKLIGEIENFGKE